MIFWSISLVWSSSQEAIIAVRTLDPAQHWMDPAAESATARKGLDLTAWAVEHLLLVQHLSVRDSEFVTCYPDTQQLEVFAHGLFQTGALLGVLRDYFLLLMEVLRSQIAQEIWHSGQGFRLAQLCSVGFFSYLCFSWMDFCSLACMDDGSICYNQPPDFLRPCVAELKFAHALLNFLLPVFDSNIFSLGAEFSGSNSNKLVPRC